METLSIEQLFTVDIEDYHNYNFKKKVYGNELINCPKNYNKIKFELRYIDNIIPNEILTKIYSFCKNGLWEIDHASNDNKSKIFFFSLNVYNNIYFIEIFNKLIIPKLDNIINKENLIIDRAYVNGHQYGSPGNFHTDGRSSLENVGPSIIIYLNCRWNPDWNGGTMFLIENGNSNVEKYLTIDFFPGRIVVFDPHISHCALDTSIYTKSEGITRMTLAYHTIYKNNC